MALQTPNRRGFITGLAALVAAPALVRAGSLMPVKVIRPETRHFLHLNMPSMAGHGYMVGDLIPVRSRLVGEGSYIVRDVLDYGRRVVLEKARHGDTIKRIADAIVMT